MLCGGIKTIRGIKVMKEISLSQNMFAEIDDEYYDIVSRLKWFAHNNRTTYYAWSRVEGQIVCMHWFIVGMPCKGYVTDHIDKNGLNNKNDNLRIVHKYQNHQNLRSSSSSQYPGVSYCSNTRCKNKWRAGIRHNGKSINLGNYQTEFEAFSAYRTSLLENNKELLPEHELLYKENIKDTQKAINIWADKYYATSLKRLEELKL